ncbi:AMP-binding protein, partial [Mycobacterium montefiorense]|uniref:AMP-binding protein n=1 Tax=Mycobacterium montefiorense TaxID=154654 RepID=UPI001F1D78B3
MGDKALALGAAGKIPTKSTEKRQKMCPDSYDNRMGQVSGFGVYELSVYPRDGSLFGLFEGCVGRFARRVAVRFRDEVLTYAQLHARAESMAVRLLDLGVRPVEPVALMTARSVEMVVGIWAILRVGATYVPIDPGYPQKRVESILRDSGAQVC